MARLCGAIFVVSTVLTVGSESDCVPEAHVGRCLFKGCFNQRSLATCHLTRCLCNEGFCSADGATCVPTPTSPPVTTTNLRDRMVDSVDTCGAVEYYNKGNFVKDTASCVAKHCTSWVSSQKASEAQCCALRCSAQIVKRDIPDCWPKLASVFHKSAAAMGTTGKRRHAKPVCTIDQGSSVIMLKQDQMHIPDWAALVDATVSDLSRKQYGNADFFVAWACGCVVAGLIVGAFVHGSRSARFVQPPLLA